MLQREICCAVCPSTTPYPAVTLCCSNLGTKDSRWLCEHGVLQVLQLTNREIPPPLLRLRRKLSDIYSGQTLYYWKLCQYFCVKLMMNVPPSHPPSLPSLPPPLPSLLPSGGQGQARAPAGRGLGGEERLAHYSDSDESSVTYTQDNQQKHSIWGRNRKNKQDIPLL